jgi:predicted molibdopterin-dependent oxidoreductase YjgC
VIPRAAFQKFADFTFQEAKILPQLDVRKRLTNAFARVLIDPALGYLEQEGDFLDSEKLIELLYRVGIVVGNRET